MTLRTIKHAALALAVLGGIGALGAGPAAHASTGSRARPHDSCTFTTLAQATIVDHLNVAGQVYLMRNNCDGNIFTRTVDPFGFSYASACVGVWSWATYSTRWSCAPTSGQYWYPFGGTVDSPEVPSSSGTYYIGYGSQNANSAYTSWYQAP